MSRLVLPAAPSPTTTSFNNGIMISNQNIIYLCIKRLFFFYFLIYKFHKQETETESFFFSRFASSYYSFWISFLFPVQYILMFWGIEIMNQPQGSSSNRWETKTNVIKENLNLIFFSPSQINQWRALTQWATAINMFPNTLGRLKIIVNS